MNFIAFVLLVTFTAVHVHAFELRMGLKLPTNLKQIDWIFKQKLVLDAIVGIKDPLRDGISDAVLKCQKAISRYQKILK